jgi:L-2-hydroxycarboxylate dehydrogenase (NAD+)
MKILVTDLRKKIIDSLRKNFDAESAGLIADYFVWAEMSGNKTQGILKMTGPTPIQEIVPEHEITIDRETTLSKLLNAGKNPAPLVSQIATTAVIEKAKAHGLGIVGVHNIESSNGAQGYYAERIAKEDLIGIVLTRSAASVAVFGGIDALFGTNPIGFAFPTSEEPLVFDMATSAMTWYGLVLAAARGESIPENMAIDNDGNPTLDPNEAMNGALLPFDRDYKGAGLGMVVEVLAGTLVGAAFGQVEGEWGALFLAVDPNLLIDVERFKVSNSELKKKILASRTKDVAGKIRLPGERALKTRQESAQSGFVDVDDSVLKILGYL